MGFSRKDSALAAEASNFSTVLALDPVVYGETAGTATAVTAAVTAFVNSFNELTEARANGVHSEQMTATKNSLRKSMLDLMRPIYASVQESTSISDAAKIALGVHVKDTHNTPQPVPDFSPLLSVTKVNGNTVSLRAANPNEPNSKARPPFVSGIAFFSYVGEEAPTDPAAFKFEGNTGRIDIDITFPASVAVGSSVWFVAFFFNNRKESGPACMPVSATLGSGSMMPPMQIAA
jgi:hypothetical protein